MTTSESTHQAIVDGDRERALRELASDLFTLVETGDLTDEEANQWMADKADQWRNGL